MYNKLEFNNRYNIMESYCFEVNEQRSKFTFSCISFSRVSEQRFRGERSMSLLFL